MTNDYGASAHYEGLSGRAYFAYQNLSAAVGGKLEVKKFDALVRPTDRVLDFGCGGGWLLRELVCREKVGVELNENAHPACVANQVRVYKRIGDVPDRDFDVIVTNHCLEHVPYPVEALRALGGLLAPEGKILIVVPIDDWREQPDHTGKDINHHLHTWTPRLLANTLVEAGLAPLDIKVLTYAWFPRWEIAYGRIPSICFDVMCWAWSVIKYRRQLFAYAKKADSVAASG